jgi:hypothetical protein
MSGTSEYYFAKRWRGIEKLGQLIGNKEQNSARSSADLSIAEEISDVISIVEKFLNFSVEIRNALLEQKLSEEDLVNEIRVLGKRMEWATSVLKEASIEVNLELNSILQSNVNGKTTNLNESEQKDEKG